MDVPPAPSDQVFIERLADRALEMEIEPLGLLLHDCVQAGASVGFVLPFSREEATTFWRDRVLPAVQSGSTLLWVARLGAGVVGTVQLGLAAITNQAHRADVAKLLVHPDARRRGIARRLTRELEAEAARLGRTLLTLDTRTGDVAEPLYRALGYETVGTIPGYCRHPSEDRLEATTLMYKRLA